MLDLFRYFLNPFETDEISRAELADYGLENLGRMTTNNPSGALSAHITATSNLLDALDVTVDNEEVKVGIQKAATQAKADFRAILPNELSKVHGACLAVYGRKGAKMLEIWPHGLEAFSAANDDELDNKLGPLVTSLTNNVAAVGATALTQATALDTGWMALYGAANSARNSNVSQGEARRVATKNLREQLFQNLLKLASLFAGMPEKAALYCPQDLLGFPVTPGNGGGAPPPPPPPPTLPEAPMGVTITPGGSGTTIVSWPAVTGATLYRVFNGPPGEGQTLVGEFSTPTAELSYGSGTMLEIRVSAVNAVGEGPKSEPVSYEVP